MKLKRKRIKIFFILILYKILLELSYIYYVNPVYEYMGFIYDLNWLKLIESYIFLIFIVINLPLNETKPSIIAVNVLNTIMIVPILSIYALKNESRVYLYAIVISFLITILIIKLFPKLSVRLKFSANKILYFLLIINTVVVYSTLLYYNGIPSLELLDFNKVYKVRGTINYGFHIMKYLVVWQANIINPFLIILSFKNKKKITFIFMCLLQLLLYLLTSHKAFLFYPLVIAFMMFFIKNGKLIIFSIYGIITIIVGSMVLYYTKLSIMIPALFINRTLFLPAQISFQYYDYFSNNDFVLLSHSIFNKFFSIPIYNIHPIKLIGTVYYRGNWANTGYLGDAYMNFGISGMIIFSFILGLILKIIDSISNSHDKKLISSAFMAILSISLTNSALLTNLLNGGILFYMLILYLYNDDKKIKKSKLQFTRGAYNDY